MYYFTPDTIAQANQQILKLEPKVGGLFCILHCLTENIEENVSYEINGKKLRSQLSFVFDLNVKTTFDEPKSSYIIFARGWVHSFFSKFIKKKIDLLACSIFFLRRYGFEREYTEEEVIDAFINCFNLQQYKDIWFSDEHNVTLAYNQGDVEDNQNEFYSKMNYTITNEHNSILFKEPIKKSATELKSAGHTQTLYAASNVQSCFLLSDEPLHQYYSIGNSKTKVTKVETLGSFSHNRIIFGAPGTGKSYTLDKEKDELLVNGGDYERVTFHPDYSYANFVGTYKPVPDEDNPKDITYKYVPGPFMRVLVNALNDPNHDYLLIIEEINRANAAAVFGDVFQLLDRNEYNKSAYPIQTSEDMQTHLKKALTNKDIEYKTLSIPDNMFIWATMNSADQGVYPMDTAFKRRWDFTYISIDDGKDIIKDRNLKLRDDEAEPEINWNALRIAINNVLVEECRVNEDKLMGPFFISTEVLDSDDACFRTAFKNKVLMYLCDDVLNHRSNTALFNAKDSKPVTYAKLCKAFDKEGLDIFADAVKNAPDVIVSNEG